MSNTLKQTSHYLSTGLVVRSAAGSLEDLSRDYVLASLAESGYLLLRGFDVNMAGFTTLVERVGTRQSLDPAREFFSKVAQKVDAGTDAIGLHCENGNSPFWPDIAWFYCEQAAVRGSQTTVCDGQIVWRLLREETRQLFSDLDITYSRKVSESQWKNYVFHSLNQRLPLAEITVAHLQDLMSGSGSAEVEALPDNAIFYRCTVGAARVSTLNSALAFANSILGPSYNYEQPDIRFANGDAIPEAVMAEVQDVTARCTADIQWRSGDIAIIDNKRVMHGRRKIEDSNRKIFNALSYL